MFSEAFGFLDGTLSFTLVPFNPSSELEELGYKGFAIGFHGAKSQLVGTSSILQTFTPHLLEYLHAVVVAGILL